MEFGKIFPQKTVGPVYRAVCLFTHRLLLVCLAVIKLLICRMHSIFNFCRVPTCPEKSWKSLEIWLFIFSGPE